MSLTLLCLLAGSAVSWVCVVVPWWERRHGRAAARRAECERMGHAWGEIFAACQNPDWPIRYCHRCGCQEQLKRCPMCSKSISRETGKPVDD
jgi:hypothetical protein